MARPFDRGEEEVAALLARAGLSRPASRCLVALLRGGAWETREAVAATELPQPDVSLGMRELVLAGVASREKADAPRGRPPLWHRLSVEAAEAVARIEARRREALVRELRDLDALRARFA